MEGSPHTPFSGPGQNRLVNQRSVQRSRCRRLVSSPCPSYHRTDSRRPDGCPSLRPPVRLPLIIVGMGLILLAGVVSVKVLETRLGGFSAPGIVVIEASGLDAAQLDALTRSWPGAALERVIAAAGPLEPFGEAFIAKLSARGDITAVFTLDPDYGEASARTTDDGRTAWKVVVVPGPELLPQNGNAWVVEAAATFTRAQVTPRAFAVGLVFPPGEPARAEGLIPSLATALDLMPRYRRSSIVVLGKPDGGMRPVLRLDRGDWGKRVRPQLADLLAPGR